MKLTGRCIIQIKCAGVKKAAKKRGWILFGLFQVYMPPPGNEIVFLAGGESFALKSSAWGVGGGRALNGKNCLHKDIFKVYKRCGK